MTQPSQSVSDAQPVCPVALIGFGEAGQAFAKGWRLDAPGLDVGAFDIKTDDAATKAGKLGDYEAAGVAGSATLAAALYWRSVAFSLVTADRALEAARAAAEQLQPGAMYFDCNSCAPGTKRAAAELIETAGGRYVDMAVMAPVHPKLHKVPLLVSGPQAGAALPVLTSLGMEPRLVSGDVGRASSIKMMRSIMVKGLEALALECILAARKAGVDDEILDSLGGSYPGVDWPKKMAYDFERSTTHGVRRAAEMREVAKTVEELGLMNGMSRAIVEWQQAVGDLALPPGDPELGVRADAILDALGQSETNEEKDD